MKKEEIFKKASVSYKGLIEVCDEFFESIVKKHYPQIDKEGLFAQLDTYLQSLLIGIAASDKKVGIEELTFIEMLTEYGNVFDKIAGRAKAFNFVSERQLDILKKVAINNSKEIPLILQIIAKLDAHIKDTNYSELILSKFFAILTCLIAIDEEAETNESKFAIELLAPLISLFPRVNVKAFLKK